MTADVRPLVEAALAEFVGRAVDELGTVGDGLAPVADTARSFVLDGGKRLRPLFCCRGVEAVGGRLGDAEIRAAASLELLQACALVHDDVIDRSETRRGQPAVHRRFAEMHRRASWAGDPDGFGEATAVLLGDLYLVWADGMLATSGLDSDALRRTRPVYDAMRVELMGGQYLDVLEQAVGGGSVERALRVATYKAGRYTVERPLQLGAVMAGGSAAAVEVLRRYGAAIGVAFQLRDDLLGVFGDPSVTGKPAGDDLREGKRTVLVAYAEQGADGTARSLLGARFGDPQLDEAGVAALQHVIVDSGAHDRVEKLIASLHDDALSVLDTDADAAGLETDAVTELRGLAAAATARAR